VSDVILKRFDHPDEARQFERGWIEMVELGGMAIGRATYAPGWRWSTHVGEAVGATHCTVEHVGLVISGHATVAMEDGTVYDLTPGILFHVPAIPHDSWVVGTEPHVTLYFLDAAVLAK
jgi:hypothetical protein